MSYGVKMSGYKIRSKLFSHFFFKLNLLICLLCIAKISIANNGLLWIKTLPWQTFAHDFSGMLSFEPIPASAIWAAWLSINAALLIFLIAEMLIQASAQKKQTNEDMSKSVLLRRWDDRLIESHKMDKRLNTYNPHLKLSTYRFRKLLNDIDFSQIK